MRERNLLGAKEGGDARAGYIFILMHYSGIVNKYFTCR